MAESEEELKSLLMKVKEESEKSWLKAQHSENEDHGIWSHHFMGNRWGDCENIYKCSGTHNSPKHITFPMVTGFSDN